jgi:tetratricopeptide (TPR) repeat protein
MSTKPAKHSRYLWVALVVLVVSATGTQVVLEGKLQRPPTMPGVHWIQSPGLMRRLAVGFNAIWADIYWIRAVQYYGDTKLSLDGKKNYDQLYPLLDITTSLDPNFNIAYRFGSILLSEGYPNGPGQTDQAITLLQKGIREMPGKWQYYHDAGFVEYWWRRDPQAAADWFLKGSKLEGAPNWLEPLAASVLAEYGAREASREMWLRLNRTAEHQWIREAAQRGLLQLDAEAHIEILEELVQKFFDMNGRFPASWDELTRAKMLRRVPVDPSGYVYVLDPATGSVNVAKNSKLFPLRSRARG